MKIYAEKSKLKCCTCTYGIWLVSSCMQFKENNLATHYQITIQYMDIHKWWMILSSLDWNVSQAINTIYSENYTWTHTNCRHTTLHISIFHPYEILHRLTIHKTQMSIYKAPNDRKYCRYTLYISSIYIIYYIWIPRN